MNRKHPGDNAGTIHGNYHNPWKIAFISVGVSLAVLLVAGLAVAAIHRDSGESLENDTAPSTSAISQNTPSTVPQPSPSAAPATAPQPAVPREDCSRYLPDLNKDSSRTVKDGVLGGALGAGLGAAGGAIADGGDGAGKGAAIGGLVGVIGGALHGNNKEQQRVEAARSQYQACLARNGR